MITIASQIVNFIIKNTTKLFLKDFHFPRIFFLQWDYNETKWKAKITRRPSGINIVIASVDMSHTGCSSGDRQQEKISKMLILIDNNFFLIIPSEGAN